MQQQPLIEKGLFGSWVGQAGTASHSRDDDRVSCGLRVYILSADHTQASRLLAQSPCMGEATTSMGADTKKDGHMVVQIHYNKSGHEHTPRGGGLARVAGQSYLAGPSVPPATPRVWA